MMSTTAAATIETPAAAAASATGITIEEDETDNAQFDQGSLATRTYLCIKEKRNCLVALALVLLLGMELTSVVLPASVRDAGAKTFQDLLERFLRGSNSTLCGARPDG
jgi:hypothetical protein